jgi:hypothetical protein
MIHLTKFRCRLHVRALIYRMPQDERSIFWEVIVSFILSRKWICTCILFWTVSEIELFHCTVHCTLYRRVPRYVLARVAKCIDIDGGILENILYWINCTNFVTWTLNTGFRNSTWYRFLINNFGTAFASSNPEKVGSNPTQVMNVCAHLFCLCCSPCRQRPCDRLIPPPRESYWLCKGSRTWKIGQGQTAPPL